MTTVSLLASAKWLKPGKTSNNFNDLNINHGFFGRGEARPSTAHHARQVHGTAILCASPELTGPDLAERAPGDGVYTTRPGTCVAVKTADCLPVLLVDERGRAAAAVHAGWRGLTAGILREAVATLASVGVEPAHLRATVGPAISRERYEVGTDVVDAVHSAACGLTSAQAALSVAKGQGDRWHADLAAAAVFALANAGVVPSNVAVMQACTYTLNDWYSYRREGKGCGSNWSWVRL